MSTLTETYHLAEIEEHWDEELKCQRNGGCDNPAAWWWRNVCCTGDEGYICTPCKDAWVRRCTEPRPHRCKNCKKPFVELEQFCILRPI